MGIEADPSTLRKAGDGAESLGEQAAELDFSDDVAEALNAMPGSPAAQAIDGFGEYMDSQGKAWAEDAKAYASAMRSAAKAHHDHDEAAEGEMGGLMGRLLGGGG